MKTTIYVVKVYEGYNVVKQYAEPFLDIALSIADAVTGLGYEVQLTSIELDV